MNPSLTSTYKGRQHEDIGIEHAWRETVIASNYNPTLIERLGINSNFRRLRRKVLNFNIKAIFKRLKIIHGHQLPNAKENFSKLPHTLRRQSHLTFIFSTLETECLKLMPLPLNVVMHILSARGLKRATQRRTIRRNALLRFRGKINKLFIQIINRSSIHTFLSESLQDRP